MKNWILCMLFLAPGSLLAHNTFFLSGDAFFCSALTQEFAEYLSSEKDPVFPYSRLDQGSSFCGNAGYESLQVKALDPQIRKDFRQLYADLRRYHPKKLNIWFAESKKDSKKLNVEHQEEMNPFIVLIYNEDYDLNEYGIGYKYNEDWVQQTVAFGHDRKHVNYEVFNRDIGRDWNFSKDVPALKVGLPDVEKKSGRAISEALVGTGSYRYFVFPTTTLDNYKAKDYTFYEMTKAGVITFNKVKNIWVGRPKAKIDQEDSETLFGNDSVDLNF